MQDKKKREKISVISEAESPRKRPISYKVATSSKILVLGADEDVHDNYIKERCNLAPILLALEHFTHERDINFYTGILNRF